jgi:hypothetical protein
MLGGIATEVIDLVLNDGPEVLSGAVARHFFDGEFLHFHFCCFAVFLADGTHGYWNWNWNWSWWWSWWWWVYLVSE